MRGNPPITDWRGKRVWLVGASSGIGAALARSLARRGAILALSARRAPALESMVAAAAQGSLALPLDIRDPDAIARASAQLQSCWGGIDLVIWLAGTWAPMRAAEFDLPRAREIVDVNLGGLLNGLAAILPMMIAQQAGGIVLVASVAGYRGLPGSLVYGPTKAAMINLAESLHLDLRERRVGVWLVNPGFVETPLTATNEFPMPALIPADTAAEEIVRGLASGRFEIHFPKRFTRVLRLLRRLPYATYFSVVGRVTGT